MKCVKNPSCRKNFDTGRSLLDLCNVTINDSEIDKVGVLISSHKISKLPNNRQAHLILQNTFNIMYKVQQQILITYRIQLSKNIFFNLSIQLNY